MLVNWEWCVYESNSPLIKDGVLVVIHNDAKVLYKTIKNPRPNQPKFVVFRY